MSHLLAMVSYKKQTVICTQTFLQPDKRFCRFDISISSLNNTNWIYFWLLILLFFYWVWKYFIKTLKILNSSPTMMSNRKFESNIVIARPTLAKKKKKMLLNNKLKWRAYGWSNLINCGIMYYGFSLFIYIKSCLVKYSVYISNI